MRRATPLAKPASLNMVFGRFFQILCSTLAAFFGVQTERQRRQDFSSSSALPYVLMGLLLAACLVASLILLVKLVLA